MPCGTSLTRGGRAEQGRCASLCLTFSFLLFQADQLTEEQIAGELASLPPLPLPREVLCIPSQILLRPGGARRSV